MKWIKAIITAVSTCILGMMGGQGKIGGKGTRRFGIPGIGLLASLSAGFRVKDLALLLLAPILIMGYGVDSVLFNLLGGNETLCRLVYGAMLGLPFLIYGMWRGIAAIIALIIAFQIRAGSLGYISWFGDLLWEDFFRYGTLGVLIAFNIYFRKKE